MLSRVRLFATPWTAAYQAPPSMGFSRQEYLSGVPLSSPAPGSLEGYTEGPGTASSELGIHTEKTRIERDTSTPMFIAALCIIARTWKQPRCPSADEWIRKLWYIYTMDSEHTRGSLLRLRERGGGHRPCQVRSTCSSHGSGAPPDKACRPTSPLTQPAGGSSRTEDTPKVARAAGLPQTKPGTASAVHPGQRHTKQGSDLLDAHTGKRGGQGGQCPQPSRMDVRAVTCSSAPSKASRGRPRRQAPTRTVGAHQAHTAGR